MLALALASLGSDSTTAMNQAWHQFVDTLRHLPQSRGEENDRRAALSEKQTLETALDQLSTLLDLRRTVQAGETPRASPAPGEATPPSGGMKRKRRPSVMSASPAPSLSSDAHLSAHPPSPGARAGTPAAAREAKRARAMAASMTPDLTDLPLRAGRKIVVKQKSGAPGGGVTHGKNHEEEDDWILGIVRKAIPGDKGKYEVQDADDTSQRWTARLRDILLLPDPDGPAASSSHPSNLEDYAKGTQVLALYPETTSFYRATVVSPPIPGTGMGRTPRGARADANAKAGQYRLAFVDDGDSVLDVDKGYVILVSAGRAITAERR